MYYSVLEVTPTNEAWIPHYVKLAADIVSKHGGKYLANSANHQTLEGEREEPAIRVIIQWPSKQSALDFMSDPDYLPLLKLRTDGSVSYHVLVEGKE